MYLDIQESRLQQRCLWGHLITHSCIYVDHTLDTFWKNFLFICIQQRDTFTLMFEQIILNHIQAPSWVTPINSWEIKRCFSDSKIWIVPN